jgi:hypothetical protein
MRRTEYCANRTDDELVAAALSVVDRGSPQQIVHGCFKRGQRGAGKALPPRWYYLGAFCTSPDIPPRERVDRTLVECLGPTSAISARGKLQLSAASRRGLSARGQPAAGPRSERGGVRPPRRDGSARTHLVEQPAGNVLLAVDRDGSELFHLCSLHEKLPLCSAFRQSAWTPQHLRNTLCRVRTDIASAFATRHHQDANCMEGRASESDGANS